MDSITQFKTIVKEGSSQVLIVTDMCRMLGVERGDIVKVTIEKAEGQK